MSALVHADAATARQPRTVVLTRWCLHLPFLRDVAAVPVPGGAAGAAAVALLNEPAVPAGDAWRVLGRKGLLAKEPATRLALLAVHRALGLAPGHRPSREVDLETAVVACGNLGNVETVTTVARAVRAGGVREVSPLMAPNASSNVVASSVALWFGFGGPNLMICSGATAGLDGLAAAIRLLRAGRARRVVLVGAEPDDSVARAIHAGPHRSGPLQAGSACVVLATGDSDDGVVVEGDDGGSAALSVGPHTGAVAFDPATAWGDVYGANGVVNVVVAAAAATAGAGPVRVRCGDRLDGGRTALVRAGRSGP